MRMRRAARAPELRRLTRHQTVGDASRAAAPHTETTGGGRKRGRSLFVTSDADADADAVEPAGPKAVLIVAKAGLSRRYEQELWEQGFKLVAGVDEAGRGPLAGPVVAAACIIPLHVNIEGIDDSKKLSAEKRDRLYDAITTHPEVVWSVEAVDVATIDRINILQATMRAMELAVAALRDGAGAEAALLVDGNRLPSGFAAARSRTVVGGDSKSFVIAAASIIAKVTRDRMMDGLHELYPAYNFRQHRGYGVPKHLAALRQHGPCPEHRRTFAPAKTWFPLQDEQEPRGGASREGRQPHGCAAMQAHS